MRVRLRIAHSMTEAPPKAAFSAAQTVGQGREIPYGYRKPSFKDYGDVIVALLCLAVMVGVAYFSALDGNYATAMRFSAAIQRILGVPNARWSTVDTRQTIVVVENDEGQRLIAKTALERYGYNVALADNGTEAAGLLRIGAGRVALIVLDTGSANVRVMQQLNNIRPHVPILVAEPAGEKLRAGATARIDRPFAALPLAAVVQKILGPRAL